MSTHVAVNDGSCSFVHSVLSQSLSLSLNPWSSLSHSSLLFTHSHTLSPHTCIETSVSDIEEAFKSFTTRPDINVLLINQHVRKSIDSEKIVPAPSA